MDPVHFENAAELLRPNAGGPVVITCEHASQRLPRAWQWADEDRWLLDTHWAYDIGAADIARSLSAELDAPCVLARFTRLLADPNRPEDSPELFRERAEGRVIQLNANLDDAERQRRLDGFHRPYHSAIDTVLGTSNAPLLFAVHTFTNLYEGQPRELELGVLFDRDEDIAHALVDRLAREGWRVAPNEPYSGKRGLIYSAERHALAHSRKTVEIEARQDLATRPEFRERLVPVLADFMRSFDGR